MKYPNSFKLENTVKILGVALAVFTVFSLATASLFNVTVVQEQCEALSSMPNDLITTDECPNIFDTWTDLITYQSYESVLETGLLGVNILAGLVSGAVFYYLRE